MPMSAPDIALLIVELMAALSLAALWFSDRQRSYMLWWAIAHAMLPLASIQLGQMRQFELPSIEMQLLLALTMATQAVTLTTGVVSYRAGRVRLPQVGAAIAAVTALFMLATLLTPTAGRFVATLVMIAALLTSASLLWRLGHFERLAACCLALRALLAIGLMTLAFNDMIRPELTRHVPSLTVLLATCTVLALLIAAYQRSLSRLRHQYRILELTQEMTAQLQGVTDEPQLAQRVLTVLAQRLKWEMGLFLKVMPTADTFVALAASGIETGRHRIGEERVLTNSGLISLAVKTRRVCHSTDLLNDPRVPAAYHGNPLLDNLVSLATIPVVHDGEALGVIVLRDAQRRELHAAEILTLESLGQVIGLSLANARNLRELAHRANHDALTGLGNRAALHDQLREHLDHRRDHRCAVMLFDLDHFKQINDALGHAVGDDLLRALAQRLQSALAERPAKLFRLGGDEFVILHDIDAVERGSAIPDAALALARELSAVIAQPLQIGELSLRTPASIGVAIAPDHGDSHELLRCADVAMYHAKQHGAGVTLYERAIDAHKLEHLTLLSAVNAGLENDEFELFYQPFINLASGAIEGCEGLIRWRHPTLGLIGAAEFMPLIEATDLIRGITRRVIDIAMGDAARWQLRGIDARIAINLSARNILDPELPTYLLQAAAEHQVEPRRIQLELTETILIKDPASAEAVMQRLAEAGFTLALDDFGTGYSSLAYLARFPIHTLKIDRSFVRDMLGHAQSRTIVESTIALARGLGLQVTAEGVEQQAEADLLRGLGCDYAQGYLFSRPVPAAQMLRQWCDGAARQHSNSLSLQGEG